MAKSLVIVESPAKARTIAGYLGGDYAVESSIGHIRDLPDRASDVPDAERKRFGALGVDVEQGFEPFYVVDTEKKKVVSALKKHLKDADELLLATDEDREGEAIAWHLVEVLKPKVPVRRMVFHEITREAIARALEQTRAIDQRLVDAQETRRILDRLYGYEVSPVLWKKVTRGLSAGRVQSVATRLVVERERERIAFVSAGYWDLLATFDPGSFEARLVAVAGKRVAQGRDFAPDGTLRDADLTVLDESDARGLVERLDGAAFSVRSADEKPYRRRPAAPFRTATLQQEASRKLRFSAQTTMRVAQRLYESGYITYMRTDSTTLSESALAAARAQVKQLFGDDYVPEKPRTYGRAVANAQEAHEAIRPAGDTFRTPDEIKGAVGREEHALYDLIWKRTLASQMEDARGQTVSLRIAATSSAGEDVEFGASGTVITFRGFLAAYEPGRDEPVDEDEMRRLPQLEVGQEVTAALLEPNGHATTPPPRYTEPTLVRALEDRGIGRPSTYAAILSTIVDRGYVFKKGTALVPTFLAFAVVNLLERHFQQLVDFDFTARMEDDLDRIAAGDEERVAWLGRFYFGDGGGPGLHHLVTEHLDEIDARAVNSIPIPGSDAVARVGRYGPYLERGDQRANLPADLAPDELTAEKAEELLAQPDNRPLGRDPESGNEIIVKVGRYGPYVTEVLSDGAEGKPKTASLFASMSPETVELQDALRLLTLPRVLGELDGEEVTAQNGRYGPYVKRGSDSRSLETEEQLFTVTLEDAKALLAQPPRRRGRGAARGPLRELGADPASGKQIVVKDGRFGPYVTDGETNASLRKADTVEGVTLERAVELLAERRAKSA
jgi:DNA topoisomerase I